MHNENATKNKRIHTVLVNTLGQKIVSGEYAPLSSLGNEVDLGKTFNISRTAIRDALKVLSSKGLITSKPKVGTIVNAQKDWNMLDATVIKWCLESPNLAHKTLSEIYDMRMMFEPMTAMIAAQSRTDNDIAHMQNALKGMAYSVSDDDKITWDVAFHKALLQSTRNNMFIAFGDIISSSLDNILRSYVQPFTVEETSWIKRHEGVFDSIVAQDPHGAKVNMIKLLTEAKETHTQRLHKKQDSYYDLSTHIKANF